MATEMGEYLVGAYLKLIVGCDFVDYGVRVPGGGVPGLRELDVVGIHFEDRKAYLCEVTTHIRGLLYKDNIETIRRIKRKHENQKDYAKTRLIMFQPVFMFWSPYVPKGYLTDHLADISGLELVINSGYTCRIIQLQEMATRQHQDTGNPAFRVLQILEALRRPEAHSE